MKISSIDHIVLTVANIDDTIHFYTQMLGMDLILFGNQRKALKFGDQKINLHLKGKEINPKAKYPTCGSTDLCLIVDNDISQVMKELKAKNIEIIEGVVKRTGANGIIHSIYINDPDGNLIELSQYVK